MINEAETPSSVNEGACSTMKALHSVFDRSFSAIDVETKILETRPSQSRACDHWSTASAQCCWKSLRLMPFMGSFENEGIHEDTTKKP
jgi:hypothetical protein